MLDEFIWGTVSRISPEAPVPVVAVDRETSYPGGAANVARNLHEFTARTSVFGLAGEDAAGATPVEASEIANHASGVVVGKLGTATLTPDELFASFANHAR